MKIAITGANGAFGRRVISGLKGKVPAQNLIISTRDPANIKALSDEGLSVRHGDYTDPASLAAAFLGADRILIVSPPVVGEAAILQHRAAIQAAKDAGASRIFYTSHMGASRHSLFPPMLAHAAAEETLRLSGVAFTSLRHGFYASAAWGMLGDALSTGSISLPEDGPVAFTTHGDLAEAAAILLSGEPSIDGVSPPLTATEAITFAQIAEMLSELTGKRIRREVISDERYREGLSAKGVPPERMALAMGFFLSARSGEFEKVGPALENILNGKPRSMKDFLATQLGQSHIP
ncbi:MAG: SDR family NAD(P)-dependent oxidoreductase [Proteobacteria bacterium]|nr:MAG: SDR family NAD(P)-dependent oxidoreductase [Pseudomonadota bacterium]